MAIETVKFLGKEIGTCDGWDGEMGCWCVYKFIPWTDRTNLPECACLQFDEDNGRVHAMDGNDRLLETWTIEYTLKVETTR